MEREKIVSPHELEAEEKMVMEGGAASPAVSETSTMTMGSQHGTSRVGSWGGELEGSGSPRNFVVRGHL